LCFVCDAPYKFNSYIKYLGSIGTCYHLNQASDPCCPKCTAILGGDFKHSRRELRRRVGLRK